MGTARDLGLLMLRLGVGASYFTRGAKVLFGWFGGGEAGETTETTSAMGSKAGERNVRLSGVLETGGGALLALSLATGTVGAALTGNMIVASSVQTPNGSCPTSPGRAVRAVRALRSSTKPSVGNRAPGVWTNE